MDRIRKLPNVTKPMAFAHRTISQLGFAAVTLNDGVYYRIEVRDPATGIRYAFRFPAQLLKDGNMVVKLSRGRFENGHEIPSSVETAVHNMLREVVEYLRNRVPKTKQRTLENTHNGMVVDKEDAVRLGKEMKAMKTNSELLKQGLIPDPIQ